MIFSSLACSPRALGSKARSAGSEWGSDAGRLNNVNPRLWRRPGSAPATTDSPPEILERSRTPSWAPLLRARRCRCRRATQPGNLFDTINLWFHSEWPSAFAVCPPPLCVYRMRSYTYYNTRSRLLAPSPGHYNKSATRLIE